MVWPDVLIGEAGGKGRTGRFKAKEIPGRQRDTELEPADAAGGLLVGTLGQLSLFSSLALSGLHHLICRPPAIGTH